MIFSFSLSHRRLLGGAVGVRKRFGSRTPFSVGGFAAFGSLWPRREKVRTTSAATQPMGEYHPGGSILQSHPQTSSMRICPAFAMLYQLRSWLPAA